MTQHGKLILISAPSGCGKTTIVDRLLKRHPDWVRSVSATTRPPRPEEKNHTDYFFVTQAEFEKMRAQQNLLESANVFGASYGTPKDFVIQSLKNEKTVILAIDVQGMKQVKKALHHIFPVMTLFILPPSVKVLRERLEGRKTEKPEEVQRRLEIAQEEIKAANLYDYTVVNKNLEETVHEIDELINKFQKERR